MQVNDFNQNGFTLKLSEISLNVQFAEDTPATGLGLYRNFRLMNSELRQHFIFNKRI